jgi:hypothetical protein
MARERVQTRCDADTAESIEDFADEKELSESEAVRRLLRAGLHLHGYDVDGLTIKGRAYQRGTVKTILLLGILGLLVYIIVAGGMI